MFLYEWVPDRLSSGIACDMPRSGRPAGSGSGNTALYLSSKALIAGVIRLALLQIVLSEDSSAVAYAVPLA